MAEDAPPIGARAPDARFVPDEPARLSYRTRLGERLRTTRVGLGLSLADVQRLSAGAVSGPALSSYERADRAISAARLALLARLYDVPIATLLPADRDRSVAEHGRRFEFDLEALRAREPNATTRAIVRFLTHIERMRGAHLRRIAVRQADLVALAALCRVSVDDLLEAYADT